MSALQDVIDEKIAWFWNYRLPELVERDLSLGRPVVPAVGNRVKVVVGVRRCGKTWRLYQEIAYLLREGVDRRHILYFNFDDERLRPYDHLLPSQVMERFYTLSPAARAGAYLFLDEIQDVPEWGVFLRRMVDTESIVCYVTGSSSKMLSTEVATEFRGRATSYELTPYSFGEYARAHGMTEVARDLYGPFTEQERLDLARMCGEYLREGGYPEAQGMDTIERIDMLQDIAANVVAADVVERHDFGSARIARMVCTQCLATSARKLSVTRLHNQLRGRGFSIGWDSLVALTGYLEEANILYRVPEFTTSVAENSRKASKVYANDQSLMIAVSSAATADVGLSLETAVYLELRRRKQFGRKNQVMSYAVREGSSVLEVDFVEGDALLGETTSLVQVSVSLEEPSTRKRELRALCAAMRAGGVTEGLVVTVGERDQIQVPEGTVRVVPAWSWLLGREG
ncbi:MAG: ATP-binding protein [Coriobacteriales bacterium]|nr:ATP-binding protein [Coriobacteriales bacterium]